MKFEIHREKGRNMYIIKDSNERYFVNWIGNIPVFNGDVSSAKVFDEVDANDALKSLNRINKNKYGKILCDKTLINLEANRNNPEWYRQQIEELQKQYEQKSKDTYDSNGAYLIYEQIIDELESILHE